MTILKKVLFVIVVVLAAIVSQSPVPLVLLVLAPNIH